MGAPPARTAAQVLAEDGAAIAAAMSPEADPQVRQARFSTILADVGLAQLDRCDRVTLTRLVDGGTTTAILLESPEPVSFLHDITLTLIHRIRRLIPPPVVPPAPGELADALLPPHRVPVGPPVRPPMGPPVGPPVRRPVGPGVGPPVEPPVPPGPGTWIEVDVVVAATLISNGDEMSTLIIPASPLPAGVYELELALERSRWQTTTADPQATYQDAATIPLS